VIKVGECLPSKHEALSLNTNTKKKKKILEQNFFGRILGGNSV
jgi:hypothetical protein